MMRLGTILINAGGLFPTASEDILGGMLGSQGWEGLQAILGILIITGQYLVRMRWFEEHLDFNSRKDIAYGKHE